MRDYLAALFWWSSSHNYFWYPIEMTSQSNNDTTRSILIDSMTFPHLCLSQNNITDIKRGNITDIKRGNITHYLILEGFDSIG
jgi:hypothetical protein